MGKTIKAVALVFLALPASSALAEVLWRGDFETGDISQWSKAQEVSPDRLEIVQSPLRQGKYALKATVYQGDNPIGASGNRNELVYMSLDPEGSERYYGWSTMFAPDYPIAYTWQVFTQWHHTGCCGSPPLEFDVNGETIGLGSSAPGGGTIWTTPLVRGVWHDFVLHVKWSADQNVGFVEIWYDGQQVLPKTFHATIFPGESTYLKQGLYRNSTVGPTGVVYHDGMTQGTTYDDVATGANIRNPPAGSSGSGAGAPSTGGNGSPLTDPTASPGPAGGCSSSGQALPALGALAVIALALARRRHARR